MDEISHLNLPQDTAPPSDAFALVTLENGSSRKVLLSDLASALGGGLYRGEAADEDAMLAITANAGDWCLRTDLNGIRFDFLGGDPAFAVNWRSFEAFIEGLYNQPNGIPVLDENGNLVLNDITVRVGLYEELKDLILSEGTLAYVKDRDLYYGGNGINTIAEMSPIGKDDPDALEPFLPKALYVADGADMAESFGGEILPDAYGRYLDDLSYIGPGGYSARFEVADLAYKGEQFKEANLKLSFDFKLSGGDYSTDGTQFYGEFITFYLGCRKFLSSDISTSDSGHADEALVRYRLTIPGQYSGNTEFSAFIQERVADGNLDTMADNQTFAAPTPVSGAWYNVRFEIEAGLIKTYFDGQLVHSYQIQHSSIANFAAAANNNNLHMQFGHDSPVHLDVKNFKYWTDLEVVAPPTAVGVAERHFTTIPVTANFQTTVTEHPHGLEVDQSNGDANLTSSLLSIFNTADPYLDISFDYDRIGAAPSAYYGYGIALFIGVDSALPTLPETYNSNTRLATGGIKVRFTAEDAALTSLDGSTSSEDGDTTFSARIADATGTLTNHIAPRYGAFKASTRLRVIIENGMVKVYEDSTLITEAPFTATNWGTQGTNTNIPSHGYIHLFAYTDNGENGINAKLSNFTIKTKAL